MVGRETISVLALGKGKPPTLRRAWLRVEKNLVFDPWDRRFIVTKPPPPHPGRSPWGCCAGLASCIVRKLHSGRRCRWG